MAASVDFGLGKFRLKRFDGKGDVVEFYRTPAALIGAKGDGIDDLELMTYDVAFRSAESAGALASMDVNLSGCVTYADRALALASTYACYFVLCDDDGNPLLADDGEEPDPT